MNKNLYTSNFNVIKKFLSRISFFSFITIIAVNILAFLFVKFPLSILKSTNQHWIRVYERVLDSKRNITADTLYIGDSVGGQIYPYNRENQLTTNGAVYPIGNYIIISNALQNNPNIKTVVYVTVPRVLTRRFERNRTCSNFIKPFLSLENLNHFDNSLYEKLNKKKLSYLYFMPIFKFLPVSEINFDDGKKENFSRIDEFNIIWIKKLYRLCEDHEVSLKLVSPPVPESLLKVTNDWAGIRNQMKNENFDFFDKIENYLNSIMYLPDKFLKDELHWQNGYIEANRNMIIQYIDRYLE